MTAMLRSNADLMEQLLATMAGMQATIDGQTNLIARLASRVSALEHHLEGTDK